MSFAYLVFDIETIPNIPLLRRVQPDLPASASEKQVADTWLEARNAKRDKDGMDSADKNDRAKRDMFPSSLLTPLTIGWLKVSREFTIVDMGVYDPGHYRAKEAVIAFWADAYASVTAVTPDDRKPWERKEAPRPGPERIERCGLVSFNGKQFDMAVLETAATRYGLSLPWWYDRELVNNEQLRNKYSRNHYDLFKLYGNDGDHWPKLDVLAKNINLPGKMGVDGSHVWPMYLAGKVQEIADYCMDDVLDTYFLFLRYAVQRAWLTASGEDMLRRLFLKGRYTNPGVCAYQAKMNELHSRPTSAG